MEEKENHVIDFIRIIFSGIIFVLLFVLKLDNIIMFIISLIAYLIVGYKVLFESIKNIFKGEIFDENFLMSIATICAFIIGEYHEAVAVMLFYSIGELLEDIIVDNSKASIAKMMDDRPDEIIVIKDNHEEKVLTKDVKINDVILVKPGDKIPLDGVVLEGEANLNTAFLTGEVMPRNVKLGDEILSGMINLDGVLKITVRSELEDSTVSKIIELVRNSEDNHAKTENFINKFAKIYTPIVCLLAILIAIVPSLFLGLDFNTWLYRALVCLVTSCPCAIVISVPLCYFGGIGAASRRGVLIKGSRYLDALESIGIFVFDKTGTLTEGVFKIEKVVPSDGVDELSLVKYAYIAESHSNHPIALSIKNAYDGDNNIKLESYKEISGYGVTALYDGKRIIAGNAKLMKENNIKVSKTETGTIIHVVYDDKYLGYLVINDCLKDSSKICIEKLKKYNIKAMMLSGDNENIVRKIANEAGIADYKSQLLPQDKVTVIKELSKDCNVAFVGDGINDAPAIKVADIGIAMGGVGSDASVEAADMVMMKDDLLSIISAIDIARYTKTVVAQNIVLALIVKIVTFVLGILGYALIWEAVVADVGITVVAVFNALKCLRYSKGH